MLSANLVTSMLAWLAAAAVAVLGAVALVGAWRSPAAGRRLRLGGTFAAALFAIAATVWQIRENGDASQARKGVRLSQPTVPALQEQIRSLERQLLRLRHSMTMRQINPVVAKQLAEYLQAFGTHQVVVSCIPNDVEAYDYATQLLNVLRAAKWDARGPELTTIFGNVQSMGINVYDDAPSDGDNTINILLTAFAKFNIPFQTRVAPSQPQAADVVELFVGAQPVLHTATAAGPRLE